MWAMPEFFFSARVPVSDTRHFDMVWTWLFILGKKRTNVLKICESDTKRCI